MCLMPLRTKDLPSHGLHNNLENTYQFSAFPHKITVKNYGKLTSIKNQIQRETETITQQAKMRLKIRDAKRTRKFQTTGKQSLRLFQININ